MALPQGKEATTAVQLIQYYQADWTGDDRIGQHSEAA